MYLYLALINPDRIKAGVLTFNYSAKRVPSHNRGAERSKVHHLRIMENVPGVLLYVLPHNALYVLIQYGSNLPL